MGKDRRANAVLFGFDFQVNAAIVLMLENIKELQSLRLESENEDIDIELYSGNHILAQAKAYSGDRHAVASARCQNHHKRLFPAICRKLINLWIRISLLFRLSRLKPMMR